jgi:hypothetical protein
MFWYSNQMKGSATMEDLTWERRRQMSCGVKVLTIVEFFDVLSKLPPGRQQEWLEQLTRTVPKPEGSKAYVREAFKSGLADRHVNTMVVEMRCQGGCWRGGFAGR